MFFTPIAFKKFISVISFKVKIYLTIFENYLLISHLRNYSDIPIQTYLMTYFDFFPRQEKNTALISEFK